MANSGTSWPLYSYSRARATAPLRVNGGRAHWDPRITTTILPMHAGPSGGLHVPPQTKSTRVISTARGRVFWGHTRTRTIDWVFQLQDQMIEYNTFRPEWQVRLASPYRWLVCQVLVPVLGWLRRRARQLGWEEAADWLSLWQGRLTLRWYRWLHDDRRRFPWTR